MSMRTLQGRSLAALAKLACTLVLAAAASHAMAQPTSGIYITKHNLGTTGTGANHVTSGTAEVCVFCHTPHQSNTAVNAPLWNKALSPGGYTTYSTTNSTTIDGGVLAVGSVSLACLSCHDGTQAMDNIVNAPGSGGLDPTGGGVNGLGYTWTTGAGVTVDADGKLTGGAALLGTDLTNDHPIGIQYCGGGITGSGTTASGTCKDADFVVPKTASINSTQVFWVDTSVGTANSRDKTDMILYTRDFSSIPGGAASTPSVECGSCHDPHVSSNQPNAGATFLRISNAGSAVCLACHVK